MKRGFRQSMAGLHTWSGLLIGWLLFAIVLTGTATVFRAEIGAWMRPEIIRRADPADAIGAAIRWLESHHPRAEGWYLAAPDDRTATVQAQFDDPTAPAGYRDIALDPVSGSPDAMRDTRGGDFFYRFHFELQLPYPWGRILASAAAMLMLIALISGIVIHARIFKDFFTLRPGKGRRSWLDAHNVLGVLALPFHLMITATGIVTLLTLTLPWGIVANYGTNTAAAFADMAPGQIDRLALGRRVPFAPIAPMLAAAERAFADGHIGRVTIAHPGDAHAAVSVVNGGRDQLGSAPDMVSFDGATGRMLSRYTEARPARLTYNVLYGLHMGNFAPAVSRWLYFIGGLALAGTIATGLILWLEARAGAGGVGHRLVARLNVGTVAGLPLAMLAYLWANRLLPPQAGRAGAEVSAFFWVWGAAILHAFARPPKRGWIEQLGCASAAAGLLPFVSFALTGRGLGQALMTGDWLFASFDLVLFALAALLFAMARKVAVHRPKQPRRHAAMASA